MEERLQKYIAGCGVASRRKAEELILSGSVKVNNVVVNTLGTKINTETDVVHVDGKQICKVRKYIYLKLYKPEGYITTVKDQFGRKTVLDLVGTEERIYPVGRLDYNTSGLLLLTNDGELSNQLMHPSYHMYKTYVATVEGTVTDESIKKLKSGVMIDGYKTQPARVELIKHMDKASLVEISIHEGKNRQVRKMFEAVGNEVRHLKRISFGKITLGTLKPGQWTYLNDDEIKFLKNQEAH